MRNVTGRAGRWGAGQVYPSCEPQQLKVDVSNTSSDLHNAGYGEIIVGWFHTCNAVL